MEHPCEWEQWSRQRIGSQCLSEPGQRCIPLRASPICKQCFVESTECDEEIKQDG